MRMSDAMYHAKRLTLLDRMIEDATSDGSREYYIHEAYGHLRELKEGIKTMPLWIKVNKYLEHHGASEWQVPELFVDERT